jgi:hypothetical protein
MEDILDDPKLATVSLEARWAYVAVLAGLNRGYPKTANGLLVLHQNRLGLLIGCGTRKARRLLEQLETAQALSVEESDSKILHVIVENWAEYQGLPGSEDFPVNRPSSVYFCASLDKVKVGHSRNLSQRLAQLEQILPEFEYLGSIEGTRADEKRIHRKLSHLCIKGEWFQDCDEVRNLISWATAGQSSGPLPTPAPTPTPKSKKKNPPYPPLKRGESEKQKSVGLKPDRGPHREPDRKPHGRPGYRPSPEAEAAFDLLTWAIGESMPGASIPEAGTERWRSWHQELDRLHTLGERGGKQGFSWEQIMAVIQWLPSHSSNDFRWGLVIRSASKLRDHFARLLAEAQARPGKRGETWRSVGKKLHEEIMRSGKVKPYRDTMETGDG